MFDSDLPKNRIIYDWLSFTSQIHTPEQIISLLGLEGCTWQTIAGHRGYRDRLYFGSISIHYNGQEGMGVWCEMSGKGCRAYEQYGTGNYDQIFDLLISNPDDMHITRLDVAYDDLCGMLDIGEIYEDTRNQRFVSKWRKYYYMGGSDGMTVDHGSKKSDIMLRIYDKAAEQGIDGHWVRVELQMRDDRAMGFVRAYKVRCIGLGKLFVSVISNYLRFVVPSDTDTNKRRWVTADYWAAFLGDAERITIFERPGVTYDVIDLEHYVLDMAGQAVKTYMDIVGQDQFLETLKRKCWRKNPKYDALRAYHEVCFYAPEETYSSTSNYS